MLELNKTVKAATIILENIHFLSIVQSQEDNVYQNYKWSFISKVTKNTKDIFPKYGEMRKAFYAGAYFRSFNKKQQKKIEINAILPFKNQNNMYEFYVNELFETLSSLAKVFTEARSRIYPKEFSKSVQGSYSEFLQLRSYLLSAIVSSLEKSQ